MSSEAISSEDDDEDIDPHSHNLFDEWFWPVANTILDWFKPRNKTDGEEQKTVHPGDMSPVQISEPSTKRTKSQKAGDKISGFKKLFPHCKERVWEELLKLDPDRKDSIGVLLRARFYEFQALGKPVTETLVELGLSEDEIKASRAYLPWFPGTDRDRVTAISSASPDLKLVDAHAFGYKVRKPHRGARKTLYTSEEKHLITAKILAAEGDGTIKTVLIGEYDWNLFQPPFPVELTKFLWNRPRYPESPDVTLWRQIPEYFRIEMALGFHMWKEENA